MCERFLYTEGGNTKQSIDVNKICTHTHTHGLYKERYLIKLRKYIHTYTHMLHACMHACMQHVESR